MEVCFLAIKFATLITKNLANSGIAISIRCSILADEDQPMPPAAISASVACKGQTALQNDCQLLVSALFQTAMGVNGCNARAGLASAPLVDRTLAIGALSACADIDAVGWPYTGIGEMTLRESEA
jgi:hypothetical protein